MATLILWGALPGNAQTLTLAVDSRYWYPFTYQVDGNAGGMHIDIVKKALTDLGYSVDIQPYPRKRCFFSADNGTVDGMISVAYHESLSEIFSFPSDAKEPHESDWRIMQVDHVVISCDPNYDYDGILSHLPTPIRLPVGESLSFDLTQAGLAVDEAKTDIQNMRKLIRDQRGVVITSSVLAEKMASDREFDGRVFINATPVSSQSYFLAFSKKSSLSQEEQMKIWERIKALREDYVYMLQLFSQY